MPAARSRAAAALLCAVMLASSPLAATGAPAPAAAASAGDEQRAPLTLIVNGVEHALVIAVLRGGDVLVGENELQAAGVSLRGAAVVLRGSVRFVLLSSLAPKVVYAVDVENLALRITADPSSLPRTVTAVDHQAGERHLATADPSGFLNYSLTSAGNGSGRALSGFFEAGAGDGGRLLTASGSFSGGTARRGLIALQTESQEHLSRSTVGDDVASTGPLGASTVIGGLGFTRHFEFQPEYAFFPTPGISGSVLTPTTADLYVNGAYVRSVHLPPGQFDLTNIPVPAGVNVTQVVLRDAAGNVQTLRGLINQTRQVLRKGLTDYDYHIGFVRREPFGDRDTYGPFAGLAAYRLGLTDFVTAGARFEQTKRLVSGGPQIDVALPIGHVSADASASRAGGTAGSAYAVAYDVYGGRVAFSVSAAAMSAHYATVSLDPSMPRTRSSVQQSVSFPVTRSVSAGILHTTSTFTDQPAGDSLHVTLRARASRSVGLTFDAQRDRGGSVLGFGGAGSATRTSAGVTADFALGKSTSAFFQTANAGDAKNADFTVSKSAPNGPGFGYTVRASAGEQGSASANLTYQSQYADLSLLANSGFGPPSSTVTLAGSVVAFKQGVFLARPIGSAYALADVSGVGYLPVFLGGQYEGRTDARGRLVVPVLSAYGDNQIGIDQMSDRVDISEDEPVRSARPKLRSGVVTAFTVRVVRAYRGTIVVRHGGRDMVPAYARLVMSGGGRTYSTDLGSEGQFYVDDTPPGAYSAELTGSGVTCAFALQLPTANVPVTNLGALSCETVP